MATNLHINKEQAQKRTGSGAIIDSFPEMTVLVAEPPKETQDPAPVDMEIFLEVAGNEGRIPEMTSRYLQQAREHLEKLQKAITDGVAEDVKTLAHKLAGSSAMCGMNALVVLLRELEGMGHERQLAVAERVFVRVTQEFARIEDFFKHNPKTKNTATALAGIKEIES